jgi:hypothetical protein
MDTSRRIKSSMLQITGIFARLKEATFISNKYIKGPALWGNAC